MKKCPKCNHNKAIEHPTLGWVECKECQKDDTRPHREPEFTTNSILNQRREYSKDIVQPYRDGRLSKEYIDAHGTKGIKASKKDIKKADYVWKDVKGHWSKYR